MDVVDGLSTRLPTIEYDTIPVIGKSFSPCNLRRGQHEGSDQSVIGSLQVIERANMPLRNDQNVRGGLRVDVPECQNVVGFINNVGRYLTVDDFHKEIVAHASLHLSLENVDGTHGCRLRCRPTPTLSCGRIVAYNVTRPARNHNPSRQARQLHVSGPGRIVPLQQFPDLASRSRRVLNRSGVFGMVSARA